MKKLLLILPFFAFIFAMMPANASPPPSDDGIHFAVLDATDCDIVTIQAQHIEKDAVLSVNLCRMELSLLLIAPEAECYTNLYSDYNTCFERPPSITIRKAEFNLSKQYQILGYSMADLYRESRNTLPITDKTYQNLGYSMAN